MGRWATRWSAEFIGCAVVMLSLCVPAGALGDEPAAKDAAALEAKQRDEEVRQLRARLSHPDPRVRGHAVAELAKLNQLDTKACAVFAELLNHKDYGIIGDIRWRVADAGEGAVPAFKTALQDKRAQVRRYASGALRRLKTCPSRLVPILIVLLRDEDASVRLSAAEVLGKVGNPTDEIMDALFNAITSHKGRAANGRAATALAGFGDRAKRFVPRIVPLLEEPITAHWAVQFLYKMGPAARAAVPALMKMFESTGRRIGTDPALALVAIGSIPEKHIPLLIEKLGDPDSSWRHSAARVLRVVGAPAVDPLIEALLDEKRPKARQHAASALGGIKGDHKKIISALLMAFDGTDQYTLYHVGNGLRWRYETSGISAEGLIPYIDHQNADVQYAAFRVLRGLSRIDAAHVDPLVAAIEHDHPRIRKDAASSVIHLGPKIARPLARHLGDESPLVRTTVLRALAKVEPGKLPTEAIDGVMRIIRKRPNEEETRLAIAVLVSAGARAKEAVPALLEILEDEGKFGKEIGQVIGEVAPESIVELRRMFTSHDPKLSAAAGEALAQANPASIPLLVRLASDETHGGRAKATLLSIEHATPRDVEALIAVLDHPDPEIRLWAVKAVSKSVREISSRETYKQREPYLPLFLKALADPDYDVRRYAAGYLSNLRAKGPSVLRHVIAALRYDDERFPRMLHAVLGRMRAGALPAVIEAAGSDDARLRRGAVKALGVLSTFHEDSVPTLLRALEDRDEHVRANAVTALALFAKYDRRALQAITARVGDRRLASLAAEALLKSKTDISQAVPALIEALSDTSLHSHHLAIVNTLVAAGADARGACPALVKRAQAASEDELKALVAAMMQIGPAEKSVQQFFRETVRGDSSARRKLVLDALAGPKTNTDAFAPLLVELFLDKQRQGRTGETLQASIVRALGRAPGAADTVIPVLVVALDDERRTVRNAAIESLRYMRGAAASAVPALTRKLYDEDLDVVRLTLATFAHLGKAGQPAAPRIMQLTRSSNASVRKAASSALRSVQSVQRRRFK
ncbi:MAG: HEAT repeat domain-containing protein [Planctomycetes bacterium]|nr:HEAT repeat domain-containing protein [Planctomycetota bacterium]